MGVSLQKKRIRLSEPKDAKRFTAHQASLIVIYSALSLPIRSGMNIGTAELLSCGPRLVMPSAPLHRAS